MDTSIIEYYSGDTTITDEVIRSANWHQATGSALTYTITVVGEVCIVTGSFTAAANRIYRIKNPITGWDRTWTSGGIEHQTIGQCISGTASWNRATSIAYNYNITGYKANNAFYMHVDENAASDRKISFICSFAKDQIV